MWKDETTETSMGSGSVIESRMEGVEGLMKKIKMQNWMMAVKMEKRTAQLEMVGASQLANGLVVKGG
jgi:cell fate regulator YaaT (PSP1 superfamily)